MGEALRRDVEARRGWRCALAFILAAPHLAVVMAGGVSPVAAQSPAPLRADSGRFTAVFFPRDTRLAHALLALAVRDDTFPGLPRSHEPVLMAIAPDRERLHQWIGDGAPDWGAAFAFPAQRRIVMQGSGAGSDAGDPRIVLRHELAHLALHEALGDLPPRWFDEGYAGYAAGEWGREEALSASVALLLRPPPPLDSLDDGFVHGASRATLAYALSYRAVAEMASLDPARGLSLLLRYWKETGALDPALRAAYAITLGQFEARWQERTRRRYGALAVLASLTVALGTGGVLALPAYVIRRRRQRTRLHTLEAAEEAADRAARQSALAQLLGEPPPDGAPAPPRIDR